MHFVSLKETSVQQFAQYASFYKEKFPKVFQVPQDSDEESEEEDSDASVVIEWKNSEAEKAFENFEKKVASFVKHNDATAFLNYLLDFKTQITQLPVSTKEAECTIQRFILYLLPIFKFAEAKDYQSTKTILGQYLEILTRSEFPLSTKVTSLLHFSNNFGAENGLKALVFEELINLTSREGSLSIVAEHARKIEQESKEWKLTEDERRSLFKTVAVALDKANDEGAFIVMHAYLKQFQKTHEDPDFVKTETDARRAIVLAVKSKAVINFEELQALKAIKQLETKQTEVFEFLNLFTSTDAKSFKAALPKFDQLLKTENLTKEEVILKKSYIQICSLSTETSNFKYSDLATLLDISADDVEEWAIEAITNRIIDAQIDQLNEVVVIKSHQLRDIKTQEWKEIQAKITLWREKFERMQLILGATPQAPVKAE